MMLVLGGSYVMRGQLHRALYTVKHGRAMHDDVPQQCCRRVTGE
jgi:hypothetical protein